MNRFRDIFNDRVSGSGSILKKLEDELLTLGSLQPTIPVPELISDLEKLKNVFPQFALFHHFITVLLDYLSSRELLSGDQLTEFIQTYRQKWKGSQSQAAEQLLREVSFQNKNVLLHSNSSAIHCLFDKHSERNEKPVLWQTLSSPANEGKIQAEILNSKGYDVHLFHEDALSKFIHQIDFAILGADFISDTFFINKSGSFPLSLILQHFQKPVYVLAEKRKYLSEKESAEFNLLKELPKPSDEIAQTSQNIKIHNFYFEAIPLTLIKKVFTEP